MLFDSGDIGHEACRSLPAVLGNLGTTPVSVDLLHDALSQLRQRLDIVAGHLEATQASLDDTRREGCRAEADEARQRMAICRRAVEMTHRILATGSTPRLVEQGHRLGEAVRMLEGALSAWRNTWVVAQGPTSLGEVNEIIRLVEGVGMGAWPLQAVELPLAEELRRVRGTLDEAPLGETADALRDFHRVVEGLLLLDAAPDPETVRVLHADLLEAARRFEKGWAAGDSGSTREVEMTENLRRIVDAVDRFGAGEMDAGAFLAEVEWLRGLAERARRETPEGAPDIDAEARIIGLATRGLDGFDEALECFARAVHEGGEVLENGREALWRGASLVQEALRRANDAAQAQAGTASPDEELE